MANEYLRRTPTSSGNSRKWSVSFWMKNSDTSQGYTAIMGAGKISPNNIYNELYFNGSQIGLNLDNAADPENYVVNAVPLYRDSSAWMHVLVSFTDQGDNANTRIKFYINGVLQNNNTGTNLDITETTFWNNSNYIHYIGSRAQQSAGTTTFKAQFSDIFLVDGQALTPDVFGFYKVGKGYVSAGSTQSTDFRPGQWVPKTPRVIKTAINNNGGFGVNGFYLPMNDSNNFGADFHCEPNSIITLKGEDLPQPRNGAPTTTDAYVSQLRTDPYAANLVLAVPGIIGGQGSGYGDYSADIKGSGTNKVLTAVGNAGVAVTASYYGSAMQFSNDGTNGAGNTDVINVPTSSDFVFTGDVTMECWFHPLATPSTASCIVGQWRSGGGTDRNFQLNFDTSNRVIAYFNSSATNYDTGTSSALALDQWHHIAAEKHGSNFTLYVNGVAVGVNANTPTAGNTSTVPFTIGSESDGSNGADYGFNGYMQDLRVYKGVAKYTGGFDVPKPYTPVGIATWRAVPDTTANNFATLNGVVKPSKYTVSNGNLTFTNSTTNWTGWLEGTVGFSTGKYYWETRIDVSTDYHHIGIVGVGITHFNSTDSYFYGVSYQTDGRFWAERNTGTQFQNGVTQSKTVGDIVQVAVDMPNKRMWIGKNGTWFSGDPSNGSSPPFDSTVGFNYTHYVPFYDSYGSSGLSINFGQNPTFSGNTTAGTFTDSNGKGLFKYQPPSDFLALCEDNLPTPAISDPGKYFKTVLYTGDGNSGRSITGIGFTPDLVWIKPRNYVDQHVLCDSIRGPLRSLYIMASNEANNGVLSFENDGFSLNSWNNVNDPGDLYVAWCWKAGGEAVTNTNGSITSVVSVNQDAGFSIVSYPSGQGSNFTIGHGLNKAPKLIIAKARNAATAWGVYFTMLGTNTNWMELQSTNAVGANNSTLSGGAFMISNATTLQISTGAFANQGTQSIAYCWAEIEGFSKFGSYTGNGSTDGPFVFTNGKPAFVMIKRTDSADNWRMYDNARGAFNGTNFVLYPNLPNIEDQANDHLDYLSNGFKLRSNNNNASGGTYIFACWMESPFTTANAK